MTNKKYEIVKKFHVLKYWMFFSDVNFSMFGHKNPGSGLGPDPDRYSAKNAGSGSRQMDPDPKHCSVRYLT